MNERMEKVMVGPPCGETADLVIGRVICGLSKGHTGLHRAEYRTGTTNWSGAKTLPEQIMETVDALRGIPMDHQPIVDTLHNYADDKSFGVTHTREMRTAADTITQLANRVRTLEEAAERKSGYEGFLEAEQMRAKAETEARAAEWETTVSSLTKLVKKYKRRAKRTKEQLDNTEKMLHEALDNNGKVIAVADRLYDSTNNYRAKWLTDTDTAEMDDVGALTEYAALRHFEAIHFESITCNSLHEFREGTSVCKLAKGHTGVCRGLVRGQRYQWTR